MSRFFKLRQIKVSPDEPDMFLASPRGLDQKPHFIARASAPGGSWKFEKRARDIWVDYEVGRRTTGDDRPYLEIVEFFREEPVLRAVISQTVPDVGQLALFGKALPYEYGARVFIRELCLSEYVFTYIFKIERRHSEPVELPYLDDIRYVRIDLNYKLTSSWNLHPPVEEIWIAVRDDRDAVAIKLALSENIVGVWDGEGNKQ